MTADENQATGLEKIDVIHVCVCVCICQCSSTEYKELLQINKKLLQRNNLEINNSYKEKNTQTTQLRMGERFEQTFLRVEKAKKHEKEFNIVKTTIKTHMPGFPWWRSC